MRGLTCTGASARVGLPRAHSGPLCLDRVAPCAWPRGRRAVEVGHVQMRWASTAAHTERTLRKSGAPVFRVKLRQPDSSEAPVAPVESANARISRMIGEQTKPVAKGDTTAAPKRSRKKAAEETEKSAKEATIPAKKMSLVDEILLLQEQNPGHILFVQVGGFYEMYDYMDNFHEMAELLSLTMSNPRKDTPRMIGFPIASLDKYVSRLVALNKTVAVAKQGPRDQHNQKEYVRVVERIVTPGTAISASDEDQDNSFLLSVSATGSGRLGLAWSDVNTGEFFLTDAAASDIGAELSRISPREVLAFKEALESFPDLDEALRMRAAADGFLLTVRDGDMFDPQLASQRFKAFWERHDPTFALPKFKPSVVSEEEAPSAFRDLPKGMTPAAAMAAGSLLGYIQENFKELDPAFYVPERVEQEGTLHMDQAAIAALEIVRTIRDQGKRGTLLADLDRTRTGAGRRLFRNPSTVVNEIERRLDMIDFFTQSPTLLHLVRSHIPSIKDVERSLQRMHIAGGRPADMVTTLSSLRAAAELREMLTNHGDIVTSTMPGAVELRRMVGGMDTLAELVEDYEGMFEAFAEKEREIAARNHESAEDAASLQSFRAVIARGFSEQVDALLAERERLSKMEEKLKIRLEEKYGVKVVLAYDNRVGPCISLAVPTKKTAAVLETDPQISTMNRQIHVTKTRYVHEDWKALGAEIMACEMDLSKAESGFLAHVCKLILNKTASIVAVSRVVAEIDVATAAAEIASERGYSRPTLVEEPITDIRACRHPVIEQAQLRRNITFIDNDIVLDGDKKAWLVTAKYGRKEYDIAAMVVFVAESISRLTEDTSAIMSIMAQAGLYVPAHSATLGVVDRIYSRVGSSDNIFANQSTFMVEMVETATILKNATPRSLVIMDEVGRGTSTQDGLSLACAILGRLVMESKCRVLFATHYHELPTLISKTFGRDCADRIRNVRMDMYMEKTGRFSYLYKVRDGVAKTSYGIEVARLAGLPESVIDTALKLRQELEHKLHSP